METTLDERRAALQQLVKHFVGATELRDIVDLVDDRVLLDAWLVLHRRVLQLANEAAL